MMPGPGSLGPGPPRPGSPRPGSTGLQGLVGWVLLAWVLGLAVAVLSYAVGPDQLVALVAGAAASFGDAVARAARLFGALTLDLVRGLAVGAFATFVVLCLLALRRGIRARAALGAVVLLWCLLVVGAGPDAQERWSAALLLAAVGALVITRRILLHAQPAVPAGREMDPR